MSGLTVDLSRNENLRNVDSHCTVAGAGMEELDFSKLLERERPRPLNMDRQRSYDERSIYELSIRVSPRLTSRAENTSRLIDHLDSLYSPGRRSGFNTSRSNSEFGTHPIVAEAWEALRRSLIYFRGQPVGTIAALDNSEEKINYDQVRIVKFSFPHFSLDALCY